MVVLKYIGYTAFFLTAFFMSFYWTFPWATAKDRVLETASAQTGMEIQAERLEPSWLTGVDAKGVMIRPRNAVEPIEIAELSARAHLLPLLAGGQGVTVQMPIAKGRVEADVVASAETIEVDGTASGIELALIPGLKDATGIPLAGSLSFEVDQLIIGRKDPKRSHGILRIRGKNLEILKGGKVANFPLPELAVGDFDWKVDIRGGKAGLDNLELKGENVEVVVDGTITLAKRIEASPVNLVLKFKPTPAFLQKEPLLGALLNNIRKAKGSDGFYAYRLVGRLAKPSFRPGAR